MLNASDICLYICDSAGRFRKHFPVFASAATVISLLSTAAVAQEAGVSLLVQPPALPPPPAGVQVPSDKVCAVFAFEDAKDRPQQLRAVCKGRVLFLGPVTSFQAIENEALKAELIDVHFDNDRQIWLLTIQDDGSTLQEDLTGQIALTAGRGPMSTIDGIALDFKAFADSGQIGVLGRPEDRARARADHIDLAQQIASARTRLAARAPIQN